MWGNDGETQWSPHLWPARDRERKKAADLVTDRGQKQSEYKILQADLECINQNNWV